MCRKKAEEISKQIDNIINRSDIISFDIFDTLITRKVLCPQDVFSLVEIKYHLQTNQHIPFRAERIAAEQEARRKAKFREITVSDIYTVLAKRLGLSKKQTDDLLCMEFACEKLLACPRKDMQKLCLDLHRQKKQLLFVSDMYWSSAAIREILVSCGYPENIDIIVSCEHGESKSSGKLWQKVFDRYPGKRFFHIGDNIVSDYRIVKEFGHEALCIENPWETFLSGKLGKRLSIYCDGNFGQALLLGRLSNEILYNHGLDKQVDEDLLIGSWLGPVFAAFCRWLSLNDKDDLLLFVTREAYVLQPMYQVYCKTAGIVPRDNKLFYASRQATAAAAFCCEENYFSAFEEIFDGTVCEFSRTHFNFVFPTSDINCSKRIILPRMKEGVLRYFAPYKDTILKQNSVQAQIYRKYVSAIKEEFPNKQLTIVDIGYRGTAQYYLSLGQKELFAGEYLFLNNITLTKQLNCPESSLAITTEGRHPLYDNLLFLEALMQVPYGQLTELIQNDSGSIEPICTEPLVISEEIQRAQKCFLQYVENEAQWAKKLGYHFDYPLSLAEDIFAALIDCDLIPKWLLSNLKIDDAFSGHKQWEYDAETRTWHSALTSFPFRFDSHHSIMSMKNRIKNYVKSHIPLSLYEPFRLIWIKYIR